MRLSTSVLLVIVAPATEAAQACNPSPAHDDDFHHAACQDWCTERYKRDHCKFCKCTACSFCGSVPPEPPGPPPAPALPPLPSPPPWHPGATGPHKPARLTAQGMRLVDDEGRHVVLSGVNVYLEWYKTFYGAELQSGSSALDVPHLRRALPAANVVRFVALLWKDSQKESDGLECSTEDASTGYLSMECVRYIDAFITQATDAGLWVIIAARAKYAAGWSGPDVWSSGELRRKMLAMWRWVAQRYKNVERIAGYEIMSEPRNKGVAQKEVAKFMGEGCEAVHEADPRALCVVGPRPYYKLWELSAEVLQPASCLRTRHSTIWNGLTPGVGPSEAKLRPSPQ